MLLLKSQLSIVYGFAGLAKLNADYLSGAILSLNWTQSGFAAIPETWHRYEFLHPVAVTGIMVEIVLALAFWIPRWRWPAAGLGVAFHAGIVVSLDHILRVQLIVFSMEMFALYILFLPRGARNGSSYRQV